jgi:putative flippase GtrA
VGRRWSRRTPVLWALVRYALVGVGNAVTYYAVYLLVLGEVGYLIAHVVGLGAAMVVSFFLNCRFTFHVRPTWGRFLLYPASQAVNIAATTVGVVGLVELGVDERLAPLVAAALAVPASFLAARLVMTRIGGGPATGTTRSPGRPAVATRDAHAEALTLPLPPFRDGISAAGR